MSKSIKTFMAGITIGSIVTMSLTTFAAGTIQNIDAIFSGIKIKVNGIDVNGDNILYNDKTYVPLADISKMLGKDVLWNFNSDTVNIADKFTQNQKSNKENPYKLGDKAIVEYDNGAYKFEITMTETLRGEEALHFASSRSRYNHGPAAVKPDMEYLLAKFRFKVLESKDNKPFILNYRVVESVNKNGTIYDAQVTVDNVPLFQGDINAGEEIEGWTFFYVYKSDEPNIVFFRKLNDQVTYFDPKN